jgi:hypothetical protein
MGFANAEGADGGFSLDVLSDANAGDVIRVDAMVSYTEVKAGCQATEEPHVLRYVLEIRKSDGYATMEELEHRSHWGE